MIPCFKAIRDRTGHRPVVITSAEYASVYTGVSYVEAVPVNAHWYMGMPKFKELAEQMCGAGIPLQFWHDRPTRSDEVGFGGKNWTVLQCHGLNHGVDMALDPDYGTSMARRCGFTRAEWCRMPLVFDRRNGERESVLFRNVNGSNAKPIIVYSLGGISSPFGFMPEMVNALTRKFGASHKLVDLGKVRGKYIYDVLGILDRAVGVITSDTFSLHMMPATKTPYVGFTVDGWTSSVPKGNCVLEVKYNSTPQRIQEVLAATESWK